MAKDKSIRLSKLAKDFNVSKDTIVDFLKKKGHTVAADDYNAKIDSSLVDLVAQEFDKDGALREKAKQMNLKADKKETISIDDVENRTEVVVEEFEKPEKDLFIKSNAAPAQQNQRIATEVPKIEVKIKGKVELDANGNLLKDKEPETKADVEQPKAEVKKEAEVLEAKEPQKVDEASEKGTDKNAANAKPKKKSVAAPIAEPLSEPVAAPAAVVEQPVVVAAPVVPAPEPKVEVDDESAPQSTPVEQEIFRTNVDRLTAPAVVGKIDLSSFEKKRTDSDGAGKKKRKRISKDKAKVQIPEGGNQHGGGGGKNAGSGNRPNNAAAADKKAKKKRPIKPEVDEEAVQKQIKDTLARLTSKGKGGGKGAKYRKEKREMFSERRQQEFEQAEREKNILKVTEFVSANELASMMDVPVTQVIGVCMNLGMMVSINQRLDAETMTLVADEFGFKVEFVSVELHESIDSDEVDTPEDLLPRPPIVTVMGHVDHGKTSLLDYIRHTNVIAGEAGGITQHIGAYSVALDDGRHITFLDTPGHEAFTAMRARGARLTDVAIIVVSADDAVMPQTVEAINHASIAGVPIVFAINKIDKNGANPEKIKEELAAMNYLVEDWGGKYQCQEISAKKGINIDKLLEKVLLEADILELKANPNKKAHGAVLESSLDKGRGYVATVLVEAGTLHQGDIIIAGSFYGHVKAMFNERGVRITEAGPATPVQVAGLNGAPQAGDNFNIMDTDREAREIANKREQLQRMVGLNTKKHITLDEIGRRIAIGNFHELNVVVKGDVDGSVEALSGSLIKLSTEQVQVNVIHRAVGQISESDILLAAASDAIVVGFQVRPSANARKVAEKEEVDIRLYSIIYDAINEIKDAIEGMLSPEIKEEITGTAEIMDVFRISKVGNVAGCIVREGKMVRSNKVRLIRDGIVIYTGDLGSLKRFKDDVKEVNTGFECGLNIDKFNDIKVGDIVEGFQQIEVKRKL
ncbi:MAG: translation initiation factor IF-2 [Bacteroidales bacterium]|nr:translation initiation factor IF-2 [Bacteroidales bacterium]